MLTGMLKMTGTDIHMVRPGVKVENKVIMVSTPDEQNQRAFLCSLRLGKRWFSYVLSSIVSPRTMPRSRFNLKRARQRVKYEQGS